MREEIDYTKLRKGTINGRIQICPTCQRKGLYHPQGMFGGGEVRPAYYLHISKKLGEYWEMSDFCVDRTSRAGG
jgi:hypothetical protein